MKSQSQCIPSGRRRQRRKDRARSALATFCLAFGKYRNVPLAKVPTDYLLWMVRTEGVPAADRWAAGQYLRAVRRHRRQGPGRPREATTPAAGATAPA
jgi:uncharacterized protein (DUF3820 family)